MQPAAGTRDAHELRDHALRMRNRVKHVAAHRQVERAIGRVETEDRLMLESQARSETGVPASRELEVRIDDVHTEHRRLIEQFGKA